MYCFVGIFPVPDKDRVIQIAAMVKCQGSSAEPFIRVIFTLDSCASIVGNQVISFADERDLLQVGTMQTRLLKLFLWSIFHAMSIIVYLLL